MKWQGKWQEKWQVNRQISKDGLKKFSHAKTGFSGNHKVFRSLAKSLKTFTFGVLMTGLLALEASAITIDPSYYRRGFQGFKKLGRSLSNPSYAVEVASGGKVQVLDVSSQNKLVSELLIPPLDKSTIQNFSREGSRFYYFGNDLLAVVYHYTALETPGVKEFIRFQRKVRIYQLQSGNFVELPEHSYLNLENLSFDSGRFELLANGRVIVKDTYMPEKMCTHISRCDKFTSQKTFELNPSTLKFELVSNFPIQVDAYSDFFLSFAQLDLSREAYGFIENKGSVSSYMSQGFTLTRRYYIFVKNTTGGEKEVMFFNARAGTEKQMSQIQVNFLNEKVLLSNVLGHDMWAPLGGDWIAYSPNANPGKDEHFNVILCKVSLELPEQFCEKEIPATLSSNLIPWRYRPPYGKPDPLAGEKLF